MKKVTTSTCSDRRSLKLEEHSSTFVNFQFHFMNYMIFVSAINLTALEPNDQNEIVNTTTQVPIFSAKKNKKWLLVSDPRSTEGNHKWRRSEKVDRLEIKMDWMIFEEID